jgi:hypothetical protein
MMMGIMYSVWTAYFFRSDICGYQRVSRLPSMERYVGFIPMAAVWVLIFYGLVKKFHL